MRCNAGVYRNSFGIRWVSKNVGTLLGSNGDTFPFSAAAGRIAGKTDWQGTRYREIRRQQEDTARLQRFGSRSSIDAKILPTNRLGQNLSQHRSAGRTKHVANE